MKHFLNVLLLTAATLIINTTGQQTYKTLSQEEKKYVDMAIIHANKQYKMRGEHMNYMTTLGEPVFKPHYTLFNMLLKSTTCTMANGASEYKHRPECMFKSGRVASQRSISCREFLPGSDIILAGIHESIEVTQLRTSLDEII
ncbi:unnamed protein product [Coregonus sp. 'balchen']|nr:unnamed protein product [Coregonus sp. 'balchen']